MKKTIIILLLLFSINLYSQNKKTKIVPKLSSVHLFTSGAQLFFNNEVEIKKGNSEILITELPTDLDKKSINLGFSNKDVEIISIVNHKKVPKSLDDLPLVKKLQSKILKLEQENLVYKMKLKDYEKEKELLYEMLKGSQSNAENSLNYFQSRNTKITNAIIKTSESIKSINSEIDSAYFKIGDINKDYQKKMCELLVKIKAEKNISCNLKYHFVVKDAGWSPVYDFRVDYKEKNLEIVRKADVYNNTGVDWNKTSLILSTAQPVMLTKIPQLKPMNFGRNEYIQDELELEEGTIEYHIKPDKDKYKSKAVSVPEFVINYEIKDKNVIPSDRKPYTVNINKLDVDYKLQYIAVPKVEENVYLTARIPDWAKLNLLDGDAYVFLDGALITKTYIKNRDQDTFDISLGKVNTVKVKRNKVDVKTGNSIIGNKIKYNFGFEIVAENFNNFPIDLKIMDQVPVATDKSVDVEVFDISDSKKDKNGILTWNFTLQPNEKKVKTFSYSIKYPEGRRFERKRVVVPCPAF